MDTFFGPNPYLITRACGFCLGNKLTALPERLADCVALEELNARGNQLAAVPAAMASLPRLQRLDLEDNKLSSFPSAILENCASLHTLLLQGNPMSADDLAATPGYADFERRRRGKYDKVISAQVMETKFDEPLNRSTL